nr:alpha/beta fold hydrolase [Desulfobacterales bacterium]
MFAPLYPFQSHFVKIKGHRLHYLDQGKGEPLLMLHGNPTWSFFYRNFIPELSKTNRAIVPDHIGCGFSDKPQDYDYTLKNHISNLEALVTYLDLSDITLIMHDWGGPIGMGFAVRNPERVKRFVILNTAAFPPPENYHFPWRIRICRTPVLGEIIVRVLNLFVRLAIPFAVMHKDRITPQIRRAYLAPYNNYGNRIAVLRFVQDVTLSARDPSYDLMLTIEENLIQFKDRPILILWGGKDFVLNKKVLEKWCSIFPEAEVRIIPDAGHYLQEDAYERIVPMISAFLKANAA